MNWLKERIGITEPIYGSSAIQTVTAQAESFAPYSESTASDLKWHTPDTTCVETQTFYVTADSGHFVLAQIIYNKVAGIRTTCQFNCKVFYPDDEPFLWTSDTLENWRIGDEQTSFHADNIDVALSEDGESISLRSSTNKLAVIDVKFTKASPGFKVGRDGTSYYGTEPSKPWGRMRHVFWPRCRVEGSILTQAGQLSMNGLGMFIHALQGMRPNFAASSWNFLNFQSPTYSAVMMEFTTPPSYGTTTVTVGGVVADGNILCAGPQARVTHDDSKEDTEVGWPEPVSATFKWSGGKTPEQQSTTAKLSGDLGKRLDRIDVLAQIPKFLKVIISQAAGTKPYIYEFSPKMPITIGEGENSKEEEGRVFMEATFIQ